jgi:hypothetical protein
MIAPALSRSTFFALLACVTASAQGPTKVSFAHDVAPLLSQKCLQCHGQASPSANLDLRTRESALKGGQHGPAIVPGAAAQSNMYRHLAGLAKPQMPMGGTLTAPEIAVVKDWIDSGAEWDATITLVAPPPADNAPTGPFKRS